ncbi:HEPN domain-containing protein [Candidatus Bathyarchaeota archaeon]|nr:HEPN domain-containing protein [Candidatus Bathyarchaeota archaeon]
MPDYVLERTTTEMFEEGPQIPRNLWTATENDYKAALSAMRIFKPGKVYPDQLFLFAGSQFVGIMGPARIPNILFERYSLDMSETANLKLLHNRILGISDPSLVLSLRWFEKYYDEPELEDELIDIMVAFEALIQVNATEKGETISIAISMLVGKEMKERQVIKDTLAKSYTLRNHIIHGTGKKIKVSSELVETVADYFRQSFKRFI